MHVVLFVVVCLILMGFYNVLFPIFFYNKKKLKYLVYENLRSFCYIFIPRISWASKYSLFFLSFSMISLCLPSYNIHVFPFFSLFGSKTLHNKYVIKLKSLCPYAMNLVSHFRSILKCNPNIYAPAFSYFGPFCSTPLWNICCSSLQGYCC